MKLFLIGFIGLVANAAMASHTLQYQGSFVVSDPYVYCELEATMSDAKSCQQTSGKFLPASIVFDGQTGNVVIGKETKSSISFNTMLANFGGNMAHYSPANEVVLIRDHSNWQRIVLYRSRGNKFYTAGYIQLRPVKAN